RFERVRVVSEEDQSPGGGQRAAPGIPLTYLLVAPGTFAIRHGKCKQNFLHALTRGKSRSGVVEGLALHKLFGFREEQIATFQSHYVEESGIRVIRRRKPIRGS